MGKPIISVRSITYANKSQDILAKYGISSYIERNTDTFKDKGCGYGLRISEKNYQKAADILNKAGIKINVER